MAKPDLGHQLTDKELAKLENKIAEAYNDAAKDMAEKVSDYFAKFEARDAAQKALIGTEVNGKEYTKADYANWRLAQMGRGERYEALQTKLATRMQDARNVAESYVQDATPGIYSLNRNYTAYTIEQVGGNVGFDLWDEQTVKRLVTEQPDLMPYYSKLAAEQRGFDLDYGKKQITKQVTSGILQGESIKQLSDRLQTNIPEMNRNSAIRSARTAVTGAQNAGRLDTYEAAKDMGIKIKKRWLATLDSRTRHEHAALDGQTVETDDYFEIDGYRLMYPGDPSGEPEMVYNCRCTLLSVMDKVSEGTARRARDEESGQNEVIANMTYSEWVNWKRGN